MAVCVCGRRAVEGKLSWRWACAPWTPSVGAEPGGPGREGTVAGEAAQEVLHLQECWAAHLGEK